MSGMSNVDQIDAQRLEYALGSPLRLRLVAELLADASGAVPIEELVVRTGRHQQDVLACLRPMERWGLLVAQSGGKAFRLNQDMPDELRETMERIVREQGKHLDRERHVRHQVLSGMIGVDPKMQLVFEMIRQVARIDVPVLISGETGTGKELVARAIHDLSPRSSGFFGAVNCATLSEELFVSEMFGHVRGAFTGAVRDHTGLVERCHDGTLFLDEIGELSRANQVKLLRVIQEGTFARVGDEKVRRSDFRLVSATNRDLKDMVATGDFREDLFYRLNVFPIRLPSLRERVEDIPYLVEEILRTQGRRFHSGDFPVAFTPAALRHIKAYDWPGNVRELENVVMRAAIMSGGRPIEAQHLPDLGHHSRERRSPTTDEAVLRSLAEVERDHIKAVLRMSGGNMRASAAVLQISRTTLYKKVKVYGIDVKALTEN